MDAKVTEAGFTKAVIAYARLHGWRVAHFRPARTKGGKWVTPVQGDGAGFPDLVMVRKRPPYAVVMAELKVGKNRQTPDQVLWEAYFTFAHIPFYVWRPGDWPEIEHVLGVPT